MKETQITKDTTIGEVIKDENEEVINILSGFGLHCFGCPLSQMETLEEAAQTHGVDLELMLQKLNSIKK